MKIFKIVAVAIAMSLTLTSCSSTFLTRNISFTDSGVKKPNAFPVLRATGYASISRQPGATSQMKQIKAMRASKIEAYRELSEQVNGVYINAKDSLNSNSVETSNNVKTEVDGFIHGARVIRQYAMGDTYATEVELDTRVVYDMYDMRGAL
ncbi:LPP20 family lipoprotein [Succinivibrio dextrinosolvens]|uniref:LPP20 family lipoprotein n=1 Tax=Succinivibrio dextrinosolvens TaxID=83771 RepID=UPI0004E0D73C|nr:LPP20 family lipoprotein [Succinivibrio dextrinosolvens]